MEPSTQTKNLYDMPWYECPDYVAVYIDRQREIFEAFGCSDDTIILSQNGKIKAFAHPSLCYDLSPEELILKT